MPEKLPEIVRNQPEDKPYLVTGRRIYVIGAQDGGFPQRGEHMPHEMWGIWLPPIKLFNGFWLWLEDDWIGKADRFVMEPFGCRFVYERKEIELERFQWAAHTRGAMALELTVRNLTQAPVQKSLALVIESNLMPVWLSERMGRKDGRDMEKRGKLLLPLGKGIQGNDADKRGIRERGQKAGVPYDYLF